jgi:hypothetical protein
VHDTCGALETDTCGAQKSTWGAQNKMTIGENTQKCFIFQMTMGTIQPIYLSQYRPKSIVDLVNKERCH